MAQVFDFVDLFAGIGGFHAALCALSGQAVLAAELDPEARAVYEANWEMAPEHDVVTLAQRPGISVPPHAVLTGGFPCQPFSKSGAQLGMGEQRGQLFHEIVKILNVHKPPLVVLENVRNIAGPRQRPVWDTVIAGLRGAGYAVSRTPAVFSPHLLPPHLGGAPQVRDRVYILATYVGREARRLEPPPVIKRAPVEGWDISKWDLERDLLVDDSDVDASYCMTDDELLWIDTWNDLLKRLGNARLPGHPLWSKYWGAAPIERPDPEGPAWKLLYEEQNVGFYQENHRVIDAWLTDNAQIRSFPPSRQKLEWQAQDAPRDLYANLLHLRPSGIRVKKPSYAPALVAMAQTPIYGPKRRKLVPREAARLQGFPDWFDFGEQRDGLTYKQLGNAINIGAMYYVIRKYVSENAEAITAADSRGAGACGRAVVEAVLAAPMTPLLEPRAE